MSLPNAPTSNKNLPIAKSRAEACRRLHQSQMTAIRLAPHSHHLPISISAQVRNETNDEPDSWSIRRIWIRSVHDVCVMQRHLAGLENDVDRLRLVNAQSQPFAAPVQQIRILHVVVFEHALLVRTGNHSHAAIRRLADG